MAKSKETRWGLSVKYTTPPTGIFLHNTRMRKKFSGG